MENASKAIYIVVGVILGLLLLSVMIYVFRQGARVNAAYDQKQITNQLELYNARFEQYDRDNNNIMDVISLCNAAFDVNLATEYDEQNAIEVEIVIGNKVFKIPNKYSNTDFVERNTVLDGNNQISIYNLVNMSLAQLGISDSLRNSQEYTFFPERFKPQNSSGITKVQVVPELTTEKLSTTRLKKDATGTKKTVYKYLFATVDDNDIQYHSVNMKISKIRLTAYCNSAWRDDV